MDKTWMMHLCNALVRGIYMKLRNKLKKLKKLLTLC